MRTVYELHDRAKGNLGSIGTSFDIQDVLALAEESTENKPLEDFLIKETSQVPYEVLRVVNRFLTRMKLDPAARITLDRLRDCLSKATSEVKLIEKRHPNA